MLPTSFRLKKDKDFKKVFKFSKPFSDGSLAIRVTENKKNVNSSRFGFVISNKIDKRSTKRNELRRKLRAIIGVNLAKVVPGYDVVIVVRKNFEYPYDYKMIEASLVFLLKKAKILND